MINPPYPEMDDLLHMMGQAGRYLPEIEASEGLSADEIRSIGETFEVKQNFH